MTRRVRARSACCNFVALGLALSFLGPGRALAQEEKSAGRAEELFRRGKALLAERDYVRACPLLAASFDLDPGTGVLLALAICHEGEGKLASASSEYKQAAERAEQEGRADRERVARERARALEPRLSTLVLAAPSQALALPGFAIRRSGVVLDRSDWGTPVPLDGGDYLIEVSAPGKKTWRTHVTLAASMDRQTVTIPPLEDVPPPPAGPPVSEELGSAFPTVGSPGAKSKQRARRNDSGTVSAGPSALQVFGLGALGAGVAGIGVGTVYAFRAMNKYEDSNRNGCEGDTCVGQGTADRLAARSAGDTATLAFALGGTLAVGGAAAFLFGGRSASLDEPGTATPGVALERRGARITLRGTLE